MTRSASEVASHSSRLLGNVYAAKTAGMVVSYTVLRGDQRLMIEEPLRIFTWDDFILSHGLLFAEGLAYVFSGFVLLRRTQRFDFAIFFLKETYGGYVKSRSQLRAKVPLCFLA